MSLVTAALIAAATAFMQLQIMNATRDCQALRAAFTRSVLPSAAGCAWMPAGRGDQ
jgi:hypothetical protein